MDNIFLICKHDQTWGQLLSVVTHLVKHIGPDIINTIDKNDYKNPHNILLIITDTVKYSSKSGTKINTKTILKMIVTLILKGCVGSQM